MNTYSSLIFVVAAILLITLFACGDDTPIQGFDLTDPRTRGVVDSVIINDIAFEHTFVDTLVPTGVLGSGLLLGSINNFESRVLLRFDGIPDTLEITKAAIVLRTLSVIGDQVRTSFTASAHQVLEDWNERTVTDANFNHNVDPTPIATAEILARVERDTVPVRFPLNEQGIQLVRDWADTNDAVPNYGVLLDFSNSTFIKTFFTLATANGPKLELEVMRGANLDTVTFTASADTYLPRQLIAPPPGRLYVDHVFGSHSILKFDLSSIPRESTVNRVVMELTVDPANTFVAESQFKMEITRLLKPFSEPDSLSLDFDLRFVATFNATSSTIKVPNEFSTDQDIGRFRRIIQDWITGQVENHGLFIRTQTPGLSISRVAIVSASVNPSAAPVVKVDFSTAPTIPNRN